MRVEIRRDDLDGNIELVKIAVLDLICNAALLLRLYEFNPLFGRQPVSDVIDDDRGILNHRGTQIFSIRLCKRSFEPE